ncbi:hypothetical protein EJB05_39273, partial [Eragrostis curvula]
MPFVRRRGWRVRTVGDALDRNSWTKDILYSNSCCSGTSYAESRYLRNTETSTFRCQRPLVSSQQSPLTNGISLECWTADRLSRGLHSATPRSLSSVRSDRRGDTPYSEHVCFYKGCVVPCSPTVELRICYAIPA